MMEATLPSCLRFFGDGHSHAAAEIFGKKINQRHRTQPDEAEAPIQHQHQAGINRKAHHAVGQILRKIDQHLFHLFHIGGQEINQIAGLNRFVKRQRQPLQVREHPLANIGINAVAGGGNPKLVEVRKGCFQKRNDDDRQREQQQEQLGVAGVERVQKGKNFRQRLLQNQVIQDQLERPRRQHHHADGRKQAQISHRQDFPILFVMAAEYFVNPDQPFEIELFALLLSTHPAQF